MNTVKFHVNENCLSLKNIPAGNKKCDREPRCVNYIMSHDFPASVNKNLTRFGGVTIGASPAFINNNLRGKQLMHCLNLSDSKFVITDGDDANLEAIFESRDQIQKSGMRILVDDKNCQLPNSDFERLPDMVQNKSYDKVPREWGRGQIKHKDPGKQNGKQIFCFCEIFGRGFEVKMISILR